jgi:hypothetical protein
MMSPFRSRVHISPAVELRAELVAAAAAAHAPPAAARASKAASPAAGIIPLPPPLLMALVPRLGQAAGQLQGPGTAFNRPESCTARASSNV